MQIYGIFLGQKLFVKDCIFYRNCFYLLFEQLSRAIFWNQENLPENITIEIAYETIFFVIVVFFSENVIFKVDEYFSCVINPQG